MAQRLVVVEILVTQHQRVQTLSYQRHQPVLTARPAAWVMQRPRHRVTETEAPVDLPDEGTAAVAGDVAAAELDLDPAPFDPWEGQRTLVAFRSCCLAGLVATGTETPLDLTNEISALGASLTVVHRRDFVSTSGKFTTCA